MPIWIHAFPSAHLYVPHGHCYLWNPPLVGLHVSTDALIALSYYSIPITLLYFVRQRRDLPFNWVFVLFATFIVACGTTHVMEILTLWYPAYWVSGGIKLFTALVSLFTALQLIPLMPKALALPSPAQLRQANLDLQEQMGQRLQIESQLKDYQGLLQRRVEERTAELSQINQRLQEEIQERRRTEEILREGENRFSTLFNGMDDWVLVYTLGSDHQLGQLIEVNESACHRLGYSREELLTLSMTDIVDPTSLDLQSAFEQLTQDRHIVVETLHRTKQGDRIPVEVSATLFTLNGLPTVQSICRDITERQRAESEREELFARERQARAEAEAANRTKDEFLAVLSHELRSPLNPILGWAKLLQVRSFEPAMVNRALATIERNAKLQTNLIDDLLDVSRILSGKLSLNVSCVDLHKVIEAALETVQLAADSKQIQLHTHLDPELGPVSGDPDRLQQIVWNLLSNAVKFTPAGGQVDVYLVQESDQAQIRVQDTGKGIEPEFLPHVFDRFRQGDGSITRQFGGLGLGLAIVRHLTELHGGDVRAESLGEGQGATFIVEIPLMRTIASSLEEPAPTPLMTLTGLQILYVDDDEDMHDLVAFVLSEQGAQMTMVHSAAAALLSLEEKRPDILVCDIGMPDMDGYTLIQKIRDHPVAEIRTIPAIALTAYAGDLNQKRALAAGFHKHLAKPAEPSTLIQGVIEVIQDALRT